MLPNQPGHDQPTEHRAVPEPEQGEQAAGVLQQLRRQVASNHDRVRSWFHARPGGAHIWRVGVALGGLVVLIVGIVLLAAPGPGWLVIFFGLGIWATEFAWAHSLLRRTRRTVGRWTAWVGRRPRWLGALVAAVGLITLGAVAVGAWLLLGNQ